MDRMTGQMPDQVKYQGKQYNLAGCRGTGLPSPEQFGLEPYSITSACRRGYILEYVCTSDELLLDSILVNAENPPPIHGVDPEPAEGFFRYVYKNLRLTTQFTGSLFIGKDAIPSMYVHAGTPRPAAYRTVLELRVEQGAIVAVRDISKEIAAQRLQPSPRRLPRSGRTRKPVEDKIELDSQRDSPE